MKSLNVAVFTVLCIFTNAQNNFDIQGADKTVIKFQLINNLIFIPVVINNVPLTFLLDTGVTETTIFSLENKEMSLQNLEKMNFAGLGSSTSIEGFKSDHNTAVIAKNFINTSCALFIILDQDINISSHVGIPVHGILGYHFFKDHPVLINYQNKTITVFKNEKDFKKKVKSYEEVRLSIEKNKPYIQADVFFSHQNSEKSKLLIDLGNSDALWLFPVHNAMLQNKKSSVNDFLGRGFNGDIFGKRSRIFSLELLNFKFLKPIIAIPDAVAIQHVNMVPDRKGSVGGEIMRRFTVGIDYSGKKMYLRKNNDYDDDFHFNMSGLDFEQTGVEWQKDVLTLESKVRNDAAMQENVINSNIQYRFVLKPVFAIAGVRSNSPGEWAGLKKGDKIISINGKKSSELSLQKILEMMKSGEGKSYIIVAERKSEKFTARFLLEDPIPYQE